MSEMAGGSSGARDPKSRWIPAIFYRGGEYWTLGYSGRTFMLRHSRGLSYIEQLLRHPGQEFHALDLVGEVGSKLSDEHSVSVTAAADDGATVVGFGDAGEMLDDEAKKDYKRRLVELSQELEQLRDGGDYGRAEKIEEEIDFLRREISRAIGKWGRHRRAGSAAERARLNVTRSIKSAIERISENYEQMGAALASSIRTGIFCRYAGASSNAIAWQFSGPGVEPVSLQQAAAARPLEHDHGFAPELAGLTTFVGRETEREVLRSLLEAAAHGRAGVAMIGGAPGVGKTRLAREIGAEATQRGFRALGGCCYDRDEFVPFVPFVEILQAAFHRSPSPEVFRDALGPNLSEIARLMPQLRRTFADAPPPSEVSSDQLRLSLFSAVTDVLMRAAAEGPMLLLLDDLQWADEGTLSLLTHLARAASSSRVMIVGTYRDIELDLAGPLARTLDELARLHLLERISLGGLPRDAVAEMVSALSGQEVPRNIVDFIYSGTEGNPFFVEALYSHLVEKSEIFDGDGEFRRDAMPSDIDVPEQLRLVIARRLARLSPGSRKMLSTAAVIGRSFNFEFLEAAVEIQADALIDYVEEADRAGLIIEAPRYREPGFQFSHELIRQAVIAELSAPRRQRLHLALAETIERIYPGELEAHADDLAHHLWNAGNLADAEKTEKYLTVAARTALAKSAYGVAANRFKNALELLKRTPDSIERKSRELTLQLEYGAAVSAANGWYVKEFGQAHERAFELCRELGEDPRLFTVLFGLWEFRLCQGNHPKARRHADELLQLAQRLDDAGTLVGVHWGAGCSRMAMGELTEAHNHFEQSVQLYDAHRDSKLAFRFGQDPCMTSLCYDAVTLFILGYPERAERSIKQSISLARKLGYPFTLAWCLCNVVKYYLFRNDFDRVEGVVREGLELTEQYDFALTDTALRAYNIIAQIELGQDAAPSFEPGRGRLVTHEFELFGTWTRALLAEGFGNRGQFEFAFQLLAQASEIMVRNRELYFEAEIHRIHGDTILKRVTSASQTNAAEILTEKSAAEQHFRIAIDVARQRSARMFQLRAATSLARLLIEQNRIAEARQLLKEACAGFTEGFNEREFKAACQLLDGIG